MYVFGLHFLSYYRYISSQDLVRMQNILNTHDQQQIHMNLRLPKQTVGAMFMGGDGAVDKTRLCCGRSGSIPTAISTNVHLSHLTLGCSRGERPLTYIYSKCKHLD